MSSSTSLTDDHRNNLRSQLQRFRNRTNTPEALGWALHNYAMDHAVDQGLLNDGRFELPVVATITLPPELTSSSPESDYYEEHEFCHITCYSVLGHQVLCLTSCTSDLVSTTVAQ